MEMRVGFIANSALDFESDGIFELDAEYEASDTSIYLGTGYVMKDEKKVLGFLR